MNIELIIFLSRLVRDGYIQSFRVNKEKIYVTLKISK